MINPFISVIMPAYNGEKYIQESINSVLFNEFHNLELIIIDDGSTDSTPEILDDISDERVIILKQENKGVSAARNLGINAAKGDYITFLDADDLFFKDSLKFRFECFNNHPEIEAVYAGPPLYCDENMNPLENKETRVFDNKKQEYINKYPIYSLFATKFLQTLQSLIIKKEAIQKIGLLDENLKIAEDFDFYIRVLENCKTYICLDRYGFQYRKAKNSLMNSADNIEKQKCATKFIISKINSYNFPKKRHRIRKRRLCSNKYLDLIESLISNNQKIEARKLFYTFLIDSKFSKSFVLKRVIKVILRLHSLI